MKKSAFSIVFLLGLTAVWPFMSCGGGRTSEASGDSLAADSGKTLVLADSTIYARSLDFGMSTFVVCTEQGDTLELDREGNGKQGEIWGNLDREGDRFALTVRGAGTDMPSVDRAVNLTDLAMVTDPWHIVNAQLIIADDTVRIESYTARELSAVGRSGKRYHYTRRPSVILK
ncbi:MAG: hypothetical protein IJ553_02065 [Alloprevotella sp.]|nr:hypothetical protein [Alloprevotella sp.]